MPLKHSSNIVILYAENDFDLYSQFQKHIKVLEHNGLIKIWDEANIVPNMAWKDAIKKSIIDSDIVIALISNDFLYSDFYYNELFKTAIELHHRHKIKLIPVLVRHCYWEVSFVNQLETVLPQERKPITDNFWNSTDFAFKQVVKSIYEEIEGKQKPEPQLVSQTNVSVSEGSQKTLLAFKRQIANAFRNRTFIIAAISIFVFLGLIAVVNANRTSNKAIENAISLTEQYRDNKKFTTLEAHRAALLPLSELLKNDVLSNHQKEKVWEVINEINSIYIKQLEIVSEQFTSEFQYSKALQTWLSVDVTYFSDKSKEILNKKINSLIHDCFNYILEASQNYLSDNQYNSDTHQLLIHQVTLLLSIKEYHNYSDRLIGICQNLNSMYVVALINEVNALVINGKYAQSVGKLEDVKKSLPYITIEQENKLNNKIADINRIIQLLNNFRQ